MLPSERIYKFLKKQVLLQYEWGFHAPSFTSHTFQFKVIGAELVGIVKIFAYDDKDTYTIKFMNERGEMMRKVSGIYPEELVDVLRANIDGSCAWEKIKDMYLIK